MYTKLKVIKCCNKSIAMDTEIYYELNLEESDKFLKLITLRKEKDPYICDFCNQRKRILTEEKTHNVLHFYSKQAIKWLMIEEIKFIKTIYAISPF